MTAPHLPFIAAVVLVALAAPATAQVADHLTCYKVRDPLLFRGTVDLDSPQFGLQPGCRIASHTPPLFCVPSEKTAVDVVNKQGQPITPLPVGGPDPGDRICYKVRCPAASPPDTEVSDQFGTRTLTRMRARLFCTPAVKVAATTTTTTTTATSTTTTTTTSTEVPTTTTSTSTSTTTSSTTTTLMADLSLTKNTSTNQVGFSNQPVTFTVQVLNSGPGTATGVIVHDAVPPGFNFMSSTATQGGYGSLSGDWVVGTLENAASATLTINTNAMCIGFAGTTQTNTAEVVRADQVDPDSPHNNHVLGEDDQDFELIMFPCN
jgi:uncharacterized repeat protein (TIGR01451 family)